MAVFFYFCVGILILNTVPFLGLASMGGFQGPGVKISGFHRLFGIFSATVFFSSSPCLRKECFLAVSFLAYVLGQCQH